MNNRTFRDFSLSDPIVRALDALGYTHPTEVQNKVIPRALDKSDLAVRAQTGSGKTAAFGIPVCEMADWAENKPQALILTPTRELAEQVKEEIANIGRLKRIRATAVYGQQSFARQQAELKQKSHVVVGTPGRVLDHIERQTLPLERVKYLVIDEADEMLNLGFIGQVEAILHALPEDRVTMLFSATLPRDVEDLCDRYMKKPIHIQVEADESLSGRTDHHFFVVGQDEKFDLLQDVTVVENPDSCMIFCQTQERVESLYTKLESLRYPCGKIHGGMEQTDRLNVMNRFRRGEFRYLVATDVAARGIDIENITLVINYDLPANAERYVHRTGRTGRAGKSGKAITFVTPSEQTLIEEMERSTELEISKAEFPPRDEVMRKKAAFEEKIRAQPMPKAHKSDPLNRGIMKLYFHGGKKKKIRAVDFVGTIAKIDGVEADDIGIINILDHVSYVDILNGKGPLVLQAMKNATIKGKVLKVQEAQKGE